MEIDQVRWFLQIFDGGKKLEPPVIRELYLAGYLEIELFPPGKEPLPNGITEKGKRVLQQQKGLYRSLSLL